MIKYGRTYHYDFSPGTTSDDRINFNWRKDILSFDKILHTEKLDGENTCLSPLGVFARSHAAPTIHPWANHLKIKHSLLVNDLKKNNLEIFGENLYAVHSIIYPKLESHFYVFGIRVLDMWLSWEETKWYSEFFDLQVVPELGLEDTNELEIEKNVLELAKQESVFGSQQNNVHSICNTCTREGIVSKNPNEILVSDFSKNVFKYVRKNHVQTDVHWSKNPMRAKLIWETTNKKF
jgi:hypothetical protein